MKNPIFRVIHKKNSITRSVWIACRFKTGFDKKRLGWMHTMDVMFLVVEERFYMFA